MDWDSLENYCNQCRKCPLCETRTNVVFGGGTRNAKILLIGEGPGRNEDESGKVFVGAAGQLLDKMLASVGLSRNDVYIANTVKCRPPQNRDPKPEEINACLPYLRAQLLLIRPKIIVCLGRIAATTVIRPDFRITKEHGTWTERVGYLMTATYHPSALLRDPSKKRDAYEDLKSIRKTLDSLSEK